ncbi:MAG: extracellular solute-binding protein [Hyphomicrobiales bacterium]|nr:extracellular solute-binding protein [Hyphomicrobiales bacterium]
MTTDALTRRTVLTGAAALALPALGRRAAAQDAVDVAAAKKEGRVAVYTSAPLAAAQKLATAFQERYGITVELFRTGGVQVLRRFMMEQDARRPGADVLVSSDLSAVRDLMAKGSFVPFRPKDFDKVPAAFNEPSGLYVAQRISIIAIYGRTDLVPPAAMPKTWTDLADPRFKGKMVMTNPNFTSLQVAVVAMLSRAHGWDFFEKLNKNDVLIVQGNEQALNLAKTGERPIVAGGDSQYASAARLQGHKIDNTFPADGTFAVPSTTSVVKGARHPNAAKLMAEFTLSLEAQKLWPESGVYAARTDVAPPLGSPPISAIKVSGIDYDYLRANAAAVKRRFSEIFSI